jgi:PASTA domain
VRAFRIAAVVGTTIAVFALGLAALLSTGGGTPQTINQGTIRVGVANRAQNGSSTGSKITIPDVRGESEREAARAFFSLGFQVVNISGELQPGTIPGKVLEQVPAAGSSVRLGNTIVHLTVGSSTPEVIRLVPQTRG